MKRIIKVITVLLLLFELLMCTACAPSRKQQTENLERDVYAQHVSLHACTGTCLNREEMAQLIYTFDKVKENWSGRHIIVINDKHIFAPTLEMITPGPHEHDENTRYDISLLEEDENGFYKGIRVSVMEEGACEIKEETAAQDENRTGDRWVLMDVASETTDDVIRSDNSITYTGEGIEFITQYENDFDSSHHAVMTFRCAMNEQPPAELRPGDELTFHLSADVISDGEPITNSFMKCYLLVQNSFNPVSDTGANDSDDGIYAGGNTFSKLPFMQHMEDTVHLTVPQKNGKNDEVYFEFITSAGTTAWVYQWNYH